jgi:rfaE bifunctional protein nucleotidyltransferase chain/domain
LGARDGHRVVLITALGEDREGRQVLALLERLDGLRVLLLPYDGPTAVKKRVRAGGQSLLRLDSGEVPGQVGQPGAEIAHALEQAGAVLVADYGRGVAASSGVRRLLSTLPRRIPVTWDPHPRGPAPVPGVRLVTPNRAEAATFAERLECAGPESLTGLAAVTRCAAGLVEAWGVQAVAVTMGSRGALLSYGEGAPVVTPAPAVRADDVCGAGDRFSTSAALSLGAGRVTTEAVQDAVESAARFVESGGATSLLGREASTPDTVSAGHPDAALALARRVSASGGVVVATGGCFDLLHAGHVATLRSARALGDCLVVCLNSDASVRRLKGPSRPLVSAADRARLLEALECVDAVLVFEEDTPVEALRRIRPDVWAKGGDYAGHHVPESAVLQEWGGTAVVLPYLQGRSTTRLVETAQLFGRSEAQRDVPVEQEERTS